MDTVDFVLHRHPRRGDVQPLRAQLVALLGPVAPTTVVCDVSRIRQPDLVALEALAVLSLAAGRHHCRFALRGVDARLEELLDIAGLSQTLPSISRLEPGRHPEHREDDFGVQEHVEPGDAPVDNIDHL